MSNWRTFYRVARSFKWGARTFAKGEIVRADGPIAERVNRERPDLLLITVQRTDRASRTPRKRRRPEEFQRAEAESGLAHLRTMASALKGEACPN